MFKTKDKRISSCMQTGSYLFLSEYPAACGGVVY
jgi:hypothetical protein